MSMPALFKGRLSIPVIGAPLFIISVPDLVIAQCKAGIVGSFPSLNARPPALLERGRFHLIGSLQTNKARKAVETAAEFHALDRFDLIEVLQRETARIERRWPVWIEVNLAREPQKHGVDPDDLPALACGVAAAPELELRGLMTIAPIADDPELARPHFRELARWSASLRAEGILPPAASGLSMGMSNDYEVAIEEGATIVRIGSALFHDE